MIKVRDVCSEIWKSINPCVDPFLSSYCAMALVVNLHYDGVKIQRTAFDFCLFSPLTPQIITDFIC